MKKPGPGTVCIRAAVLPRTRVPFRYSERPRCALFYLFEPVRIGFSRKSSLKRCARVRALASFRASPRHAFAPLSAAGPGLARAGPSSETSFRAEIVPGNALARVRLSPRARPHSLDNTCLRNTWIMFVFPSHHSEIFLFC